MALTNDIYILQKSGTGNKIICFYVYL